MTWTKVANVGAVKTGRKCCSTATKESVTSMSRLPCHGATWGVVDQPKLPKPGEEAAYFCAGGRRKGPPKSAKLELRTSRSGTHPPGAKCCAVHTLSPGTPGERAG